MMALNDDDNTHNSNNTDDTYIVFWLLQVDPDKAFAVQIAHEESVVASSVAYIQCALLYTSSNAERRIRSTFLSHDTAVLHMLCAYLIHTMLPLMTKPIKQDMSH